MSVTAPTTTTLGAAIATQTTRTVTVASTTGMSAGNFLVAGQEQMLILSVDSSTQLTVQRAVAGSASRIHPNGATVYYGAGSVFGARTSDQSNAQATMVATASALPSYRLPLGSQVLDPNTGNVFMLVDFTAPVFSGVTVSISNDGLFTAAPLTTAHQGSVGVVVETDKPTSDKWGWVQVYGAYSNAQLANGDSAVTSAYIALAASSVTTPAAGLAAIVNTTSTAVAQIFGMFITGAATTAVTSAASHVGVGVPVWLNFPYVRGFATDTGTS